MKGHQGSSNSPRSLTKISLRAQGGSEQGQGSPISIRLVNPGSAGLLLGPFPRLGALDDHCLYPSTRDLRLTGGNEETVRTGYFPYSTRTSTGLCKCLSLGAY